MIRFKLKSRFVSCFVFFPVSRPYFLNCYGVNPSGFVLSWGFLGVGCYTLISVDNK